MSSSGIGFILETYLFSFFCILPLYPAIMPELIHFGKAAA